MLPLLVHLEECTMDNAYNIYLFWSRNAVARDDVNNQGLKTKGQTYFLDYIGYTGATQIGYTGATRISHPSCRRWPVN